MFKSKFNMALIIGIILMLSLIALWYVTPVPKVSPLVLSDIENLDVIATLEGKTGGIKYLFPQAGGYGVVEFPILIEAHVYTTNGTTRLQNTTAVNMTNPVCSKWSAVSEANVLLDKKYHLLSWEDIDKDERLSSSDRINLNKTEPAPVGPRWYDVQEVWKYGAFCNIIARPRLGDNLILRTDLNVARGDTIQLESITAIDLTNPVCTQWRIIEGSSLEALLEKEYHILNWEDIDKDGNLSSSDRIYINVTKSISADALGPRWCEVQEVWKYGAICYMNITRETIPLFSGSSTSVINKLTRRYVEDAPEASARMEGYGLLYPSHLKPDEDIHEIWLGDLNRTGTLRFVGLVEIEDVELYEYFLNETATLETDLGMGFGNHIITSIKNVLVEPLSGLPVYTKNETLIIRLEKTDAVGNVIIYPLVYVTYKDKGEIDLATPRLAHGAMQLLEFDKEVKGWILGAIVIILTVTFIFNTRSLSRARKMLPKAKT